MKFSILLSFVFCLISHAVLAAQGVVTVESQYSLEETAARFETVLKSKGMRVFNRIDHQGNAKSVDLTMKPAIVFIFGNPKIGTKLMNCSDTAALDLPQKMLIREDAQQMVALLYNKPLYLKNRHHMKGCDELLDTVSQALEGIARAAAE